MKPFGGAVKTSHVIRRAHAYLIFQTMNTPLTSGIPRMKRQLFLFLGCSSTQETEKRVANVHNQDWGFEVVLANGRLDRKHFKVEK